MAPSQYSTHKITTHHPQCLSIKSSENMVAYSYSPVLSSPVQSRACMYHGLMPGHPRPPSVGAISPPSHPILPPRPGPTTVAIVCGPSPHFPPYYALPSIFCLTVAHPNFLPYYEPTPISCPLWAPPQFPASPWPPPGGESLLH